MPTQTTVKADVFFPDFCKVQIKASGDADWTDFGVCTGDAKSTWEWDENRVMSSDAQLIKSVTKNHRIKGSFELMNLNRTAIQKLSGGAMELVQTAGSPIATIPNQTIAANWNDGIIYDLEMVVSSTDSTNVRTTAAPTLTSVTLDAAGTPEVLTAGNDYVVFADTNSKSGWAMSFISANMTTVSPKTKAITIDYGSNTPVASDTIYAGASSEIITPYALKFDHTDDSGLHRSLEIFSATTDSGGFQINFLSALSDGAETMPIAFTGSIDSTRTNKRQLFAWTIENGAE